MWGDTDARTYSYPSAHMDTAAYVHTLSYLYPCTQSYANPNGHLHTCAYAHAAATHAYTTTTANGHARSRPQGGVPGFPL